MLKYWDRYRQSWSSFNRKWTAESEKPYLKKIHGQACPDRRRRRRRALAQRDVARLEPVREPDPHFLLDVALQLRVPLLPADARVLRPAGVVVLEPQRDEKSDNHQCCKDHDDLAEEAVLKIRNPSGIEI